MNLEDQVVNLELAKKLKELGVSQESIFFWFEIKIDKYEVWQTIHLMEHWEGYPLKDVKPVDKISAFTAAELGEMLPDTIKNEDDEKCLFFADKYNKCYRIGYLYDTEEVCSPYLDSKGDSFANAMAKMLIHLLENNLVEAEDL